MIRILIVDDKEESRRVLSMYLDKAGFEVVGMAENGEQGLLLASAEQPDVIVADIEMPTMSGSEMIEALLQAGAADNIGFVLLTAGNGIRTEALDRLLKQRRLRREDKPVKREYLIAAINKVHNRIA